MPTAPHPPHLLAELTSEAMLDLPMSARLLWVLLSSRPPGLEPLRLNLKRVKASAFPFDAEVTVDSLTLDVLELEDRGLLATSIGRDGRERYRILVRDPVEPCAPQNPQEVAAGHASECPSQPAHSGRIATVEREREGESAGEGEPRRPAHSRPKLTQPARYCADHLPLGPGRERCVLCEQARLSAKIWIEFVRNGQTPPDDLSSPPVDTYADRAPSPPSTSTSGSTPGSRRRPRFDVLDPFDDPDSPEFLPGGLPY